ncbi:hypothetical protein B0F90DRAFT_381038 [Multifurca ochricompacta]|uniref:Uncharacterized protein n=1 Tax=Multifurca ochricompacta TaxID=376703 RepID=A0AAD4M4K2_9AGAM|nr:hypothetical protein B0F90DRAFT_381038 [Multifurca ochricompacta]
MRWMAHQSFIDARSHGNGNCFCFDGSHSPWMSFVLNSVLLYCFFCARCMCISCKKSLRGHSSTRTLARFYKQNSLHLCMSFFLASLIAPCALLYDHLITLFLPHSSLYRPRICITQPSLQLHFVRFLLERLTPLPPHLLLSN